MQGNGITNMARKKSSKKKPAKRVKRRYSSESGVTPASPTTSLTY